MTARPQQFHLIIPTGSKVVTRHDRRVGVVVHAPATLENAYRVKFADGNDASFRRAELPIFRQDQQIIPDQISDSELYRFVVSHVRLAQVAADFSSCLSWSVRLHYRAPEQEAR
jgi:hypothetical protein